LKSFNKIPRLSRLTSILLSLQARRTVSVVALAEKFHVSARTIYRDLSALEEAGVPIVFEEGRMVSLMEGFSLPPVMFSESEANALIMAEQIIKRSKDASFVKEFSQAVEKIKSVLKSNTKEKSDLLSERTIIAKNWQNTRTSTYLSQIQKALTDFQVLKLEYKKENEKPSSRKVEAFALYRNTEENWVLIAHCRLRKDFRNFRLDRMVKLQMLEEKFAPHKISLEEFIAFQKEKHFKGQ